MRWPDGYILRTQRWKIRGSNPGSRYKLANYHSSCCAGKISTLPLRSFTTKHHFDAPLVTPYFPMKFFVDHFAMKFFVINFSMSFFVLIALFIATLTSWKITVIRGIAVRETRLSASWSPNWGHRKPRAVQHSSIVLRGLRGPFIFPPLCRETPVSRTADVSFF